MVYKSGVLVQCGVLRLLVSHAWNDGLVRAAVGKIIIIHFQIRESAVVQRWKRVQLPPSRFRRRLGILLLIASINIENDYLCVFSDLFALTMQF